MKRICAALVSFVFTAAAFSLEPASSDGAAMSRRRTALRCLELAKSYLAEKDYPSASSTAQMGISYDDGISDLYFILAQSENSRGAVIADCLPLVAHALELDSWADYNRDNARLMYADMLCDTGSYEKVDSILDNAPSIYSSDAEFVRTKAYYRMGDEESLFKARVKIDGARRIYPDDTRFPLLFFTYENPENQNPDVRKLTEVFIKQINQYVEVSPDKDAELEIKAAIFAKGKEKVNLLKSFKARGLIHPLYARCALEAGLISQTDAFDYLCEFASKSIDWQLVEDFLPLLTEKNALAVAAEYFSSYGGNVEYDSDGDRIPDMFIKYSRGRPETVFRDSNQDGKIEWTITCDFGVPVACMINSTSIRWEDFPYLKSVETPYTAAGNTAVFTLTGEALAWSPVKVECRRLLKKQLSMDFYFPELTGEAMPDMYSLLESSSDFKVRSLEKENAVINFSILDSEIKEAVYRSNGKVYAYARFENNVPVMRLCDNDGDGNFETTEYYAVDDDGSMEVHSLEDLRSVTTNMFGVPKDESYFYLKSIHIDMNKDSVPDFTEEYFPHGGKTSSYDTDGDGKWNVRSSTDGQGNTRDSFVVPPSGNIVEVESSGGKPVAVSSGAEKFSVTKDSLFDFYWIGDISDLPEQFRSECARRALLELSKTPPQGYSIIVEYKGERFLAVRCNSLCFGKRVPKIEYDNVDEK